MSFLASIFPCLRPKPVPPVAAPVPCGLVAHVCDDREVAALKAMQVSTVRTTYYTQGTEPGEFEQRLARLRAAGIEPLVVTHDFRTLMADWIAATMGNMDTRFPGTLWQVGNEWNTSGHPYGKGGKYASLIEAIRAASPAIRLVGMGLGSDDNQDLYLAEYLVAKLAPLEAWCVHCYGVPLQPAFDKYPALAIQRLNGYMPVWVTEFGVDRSALEQAWGPLTVAQCDTHQAEFIRGALASTATSGVERVYGYALRDGDDTGFGVTRMDYTPRSAALVIEQHNS